MSVLSHTPKTERIRELNDAFRRTFEGGRVMLTAGFQSLPETARREAIERVKTFDAFDPDNDPRGEHDFLDFEIEGRKLFAKIDYYDLAMIYGSEDPSDPSQTTRVMTIMLAAEY
ncbi:DUF3768 domain-containing protein [Rhodoplanes sp. SY1]|uniref:DUF3768 domain-containing protein n=1 Tax=Rhodoplanes sp. SY1 TaxID=3166646 RepID=UPI0038B4B780